MGRQGEEGEAMRSKVKGWERMGREEKGWEYINSDGNEEYRMGIDGEEIVTKMKGWDKLGRKREYGEVWEAREKGWGRRGMGNGGDMGSQRGERYRDGKGWGVRWEG